MMELFSPLSRLSSFILRRNEKTRPHHHSQKECKRNVNVSIKKRTGLVLSASSSTGNNWESERARRSRWKSRAEVLDNIKSLLATAPIPSRHFLPLFWSDEDSPPALLRNAIRNDPSTSGDDNLWGWHLTRPVKCWRSVVSSFSRLCIWNP